MRVFSLSSATAMTTASPRPIGTVMSAMSSVLTIDLQSSGSWQLGREVLEAHPGEVVEAVPVRRTRAPGSPRTGGRRTASCRSAAGRRRRSPSGGRDAARRTPCGARPARRGLQPRPAARRFARGDHSRHSHLPPVLLGDQSWRSRRASPWRSPCPGTASGIMSLMSVERPGHGAPRSRSPRSRCPACRGRSARAPGSRPRARPCRRP